MGRNRTRTDPDRYLTQRQGNFHYKRRVPVTIVHLDEGTPHVRTSLKIDDRGLARKKRDLRVGRRCAVGASQGRLPALPQPRGRSVGDPEQIPAQQRPAADKVSHRLLVPTLVRGRGQWSA